MSDSVRLESSWKKMIGLEFAKPYFAQIKEQLLAERKAGKIIYPPFSQLFAAFDYTPFDKVKVVILGQDPYHGPGQAHGLCFSVNDGVAFPPSLLNIFKEIQADCGTPIPVSGNLTRWATQGVLLLNAILSVRHGEAGSHKDLGWQQFTDTVIATLSQQRQQLVFMLWGNFARSKKSLIDTGKHLVLEAAHPSPLSAYNGFMGCKHFSKTNQYLIAHGLEPIVW